MSVKIMNLVWEHCVHNGNALLLMLAIADHADDSGKAWPGVERLAQKVRVTDRTIYNLIKELEASGDLVIAHGGGRHRANHYQINMKKLQGKTFSEKRNSEKHSLKVTTQNPESYDTKTLKPVSPQPSVEPSVNHQGENAPASQDATPANKRKRREPETGWPGYESIPDDWRAYVDSKRPDLDPAAVFEDFRGKALAKGYVYRDWRQAWQTWVRGTTARPHLLRQQATAPDRVPIAVPTHSDWLLEMERAAGPGSRLFDLIQTVKRADSMTTRQYEFFRSKGMPQ